MYCYIGTVEQSVAPQDRVKVVLVAPLSKYKKRLLEEVENRAYQCGVSLLIKKEKKTVRISLNGAKVNVEAMLLYIKFHPDNLNNNNYERY